MDDEEIPDLLPTGRDAAVASDEGVGEPARGVRRRGTDPPGLGADLRRAAASGSSDAEGSSLAAQAEAPGDALEFDLLEARGDEIPWDSPLRSENPLGDFAAQGEPAPRLDLSGTHREQELPDLEVRRSEPPAARISSAPSAGARPGGASAALRSPKTSAAGPRHSSPVPARGSVPPAARFPSRYPGASAIASARPSQFPGADAVAVPAQAASGAFGGMIDLPDWDLEFGGAASAQRNLPLEAASEVAEVPWPLCRTPEAYEIRIDPQEALEASGYGLPPDAFWKTPSYFLRARRARALLTSRRGEAASVLRATEARRDRQLAGLARALRAVLAARERFSDLYAEADRWDQLLLERKRAFSAADQAAAQELNGLLDHIAKKEETVAERRRATLAASEELNEAEHAVARGAAIVRRLDIERRNVADRARAQVPVGANMPADLGAQYLALGREREAALASLGPLEEARDRAKKKLQESQEAEYLAQAELGRLLAQKEALQMAQEGLNSEHARGIDQAREGRQSALAHAGRAVIELHGEVPVDAETRKTLLSLDHAVTEAFRALELLSSAAGSLDEQAAARGRTVLVVGGLLAGALLVALLVF